MKRAGTLFTVVCAALTTLLLGAAPAASAAATQESALTERVLAEDAGPTVVQPLASPKCSGTASWGKIRYQVCFRYNCDSDSCFTRGYLGLINTATSARTVNWRMDVSTSYGLESFDSTGTYRLAAGAQQTIFGPYSWEHFTCNFYHYQWLKIQYDSLGWSPWIVATGQRSPKATSPSRSARSSRQYTQKH